MWGDKLQIADLLTRLEGVKKTGENRYQCKCPTHNDREPSLTVSETHDKILVHCHAGCNTWDILREIGLKMSDLYKGDKLPETWQEKFERYKKKQIEEVYHYTDTDNKYLYSKLRMTGKDIVYGRVNKDKTFFNMGIQHKDKVLYNLPAVVKAVDKGYPIYFVEGEKDVNTLKNIGLVATTCGAVGDWNKDFAKFFTGARVIILPDNDEPGKTLADKVKNDLKYYAHAVKIVHTSVEPKGDVTDYIKEEGHSLQDLKTLIDDISWSYAPWINTNAKRDGTFTLSVNEGVLADAIEKTLEYVLIKNKVTLEEEMYIYDKGVYHKSSKNEIKALIKKYLPKELVKDSKLNAVYNLLLSSTNGIKYPEDINPKEFITNLQNGLFDIQRSELLPHTPELLSTYQLNCSYVKTEEPMLFLKYINDLCTHDGVIDTEQVAVLQEWTGLILSNVNGFKFKKALCLYSPLGNTGKSILPRLWADILGSGFVINVPIQKMADRFSMGDIYGARLIAIGDQNGNDLEDSSMFKQLTGGDYVRVEPKGRTGFNYLFRGCIVMVCNDLPSFKDDKGGHVFERIELMKCQNVIPINQRNPTLYTKMKQELDGIYAWGLEGLNRLIKNNYRFTYSRANAKALEEYRGNIDTLHAFITENCELTENYKSDRIKKTDFETDYSNWCFINEVNGLAPKNIKERAIKNNLQFGKTNGIYFYKGIRYKTESRYYKGASQGQLKG